MANSNSFLQGVFSELSPHRFVPGWLWGLHQEQTAKAKDMILPPVVQEDSHFPASLSKLINEGKYFPHSLLSRIVQKMVPP